MSAVFYSDADGEITITVDGENIENPIEHLEELLEEENNDE